MARIPVSGMPQIPNKHYFTIGEVSKLFAVEPHVLRYWEQEFAELNPVRRRGKRRYYRRQEVELVSRIIDLLYNKEFTISGARKQLKNEAQEALRDDSEFEAEVEQTIGHLNKALKILSSE